MGHFIKLSSMSKEIRDEMGLLLESVGGCWCRCCGIMLVLIMVFVGNGVGPLVYGCWQERLLLPRRYLYLNINNSIGFIAFKTLLLVLSQTKSKIPARYTHHLKLYFTAELELGVKPKDESEIDFQPNHGG